MTADHGEEFLDHDGKGHGHDLWNELLRVPYILHIPGSSPNARVIKAQTALIDTAPTLLSLSRIPQTAWPAGMDGIDLLQYLDGKTPLPLRPIYSEVTRPKGKKGVFDIRSVMVDNQKFIRYFNKESEDRLFNLKDDPGEKNNLADRFPDKVDEFARLLIAATSGSTAAGGQKAILDPQTEQTLRSLGYLQ